jgi:hypothetical protein
MLRVGFEPTRDFSQRILSPQRLPFRHRSPEAAEYSSLCQAPNSPLRSLHARMQGPICDIGRAWPVAFWSYSVPFASHLAHPPDRPPVARFPERRMLKHAPSFRRSRLPDRSTGDGAAFRAARQCAVPALGGVPKLAGQRHGAGSPARLSPRGAAHRRSCVRCGWRVGGQSDIGRLCSPPG